VLQFCVSARRGEKQGAEAAENGGLSRRGRAAGWTAPEYGTRRPRRRGLHSLTGRRGGGRRAGAGRLGRGQGHHGRQAPQRGGRAVRLRTTHELPTVLQRLIYGLSTATKCAKSRVTVDTHGGGGGPQPGTAPPGAGGAAGFMLLLAWRGGLSHARTSAKASPVLWGRPGAEEGALSAGAFFLNAAAHGAETSMAVLKFVYNQRTEEERGCSLESSKPRARLLGWEAGVRACWSGASSALPRGGAEVFVHFGRGQCSGGFSARHGASGGRQRR